MPYSGEADAANILLVLLLLVGQAEHCTDSLAGPIPAISPIGSASGKVGSDSQTDTMRLRASRKCRSARLARSTRIAPSQQRLRLTTSAPED
jgi:hypothetical protein